MRAGAGCRQCGIEESSDALFTRNIIVWSTEMGKKHSSGILVVAVPSRPAWEE